MDAAAVLLRLIGKHRDVDVCHLHWSLFPNHHAAEDIISCLGVPRVVGPGAKLSRWQ